LTATREQHNTPKISPFFCNPDDNEFSSILLDYFYSSFRGQPISVGNHYAQILPQFDLIYLIIFGVFIQLQLHPLSRFVNGMPNTSFGQINVVTNNFYEEFYLLSFLFLHSFSLK